MWGKAKEPVVPVTAASLGALVTGEEPTKKKKKKRKLKKGKVSKEEFEGLRQFREETKPSLFIENPGWRKLERSRSLSRSRSSTAEPAPAPASAPLSAWCRRHTAGSARPRPRSRGSHGRKSCASVP